MRSVAGVVHWPAAPSPLLDGDRPVLINRSLVTGNYFDVMREIAGSGRGWGDCNNHAAFMAALAHSVRLPVFWAICTPEGCPEDQRHIYAALLVADDEGPYDDGDFLALDTGRRYPVFGRHSDLSGIATERTWTPAYMGAENYAQEAA